MSLQFADFDADGYMDIVTAIWEGTVFLLPGSADGFGQPEYIKDRNDELIILSRFYDMKKRDYISTKVLFIGQFMKKFGRSGK